MVRVRLDKIFRFYGQLPGGPGLAGTRKSTFWILLELQMMDVAVTSGAVRCAKLQSNCHQQQTNTGRMPFLSPNQQRHSLKEKQNNISVYS